MRHIKIYKYILTSSIFPGKLFVDTSEEDYTPRHDSSHFMSVQPRPPFDVSLEVSMKEFLKVFVQGSSLILVQVGKLLLIFILSFMIPLFLGVFK